MERRSAKTTNLGGEIANIGGSAHVQFNAINQNEGIIGFKRGKTHAN